MVDVVQDDVLDSDDLLREWDEVMEKCEALEHGNAELEKELTIMRAKVEFVNSLQEEADKYSYSYALAAQIMKLTSSLADVEELQKKSFEEIVKACRAFKTNRKVLQWKKDDKINALKSLEKEVAVAR